MLISRLAGLAASLEVHRYLLAEFMDLPISDGPDFYLPWSGLVRMALFNLLQFPSPYEVKYGQSISVTPRLCQQRRGLL